jgi:hypothetical protein
MDEPFFISASGDIGSALTDPPTAWTPILTGGMFAGTCPNWLHADRSVVAGGDTLLPYWTQGMGKKSNNHIFPLIGLQQTLNKRFYFYA